MPIGQTERQNHQAASNRPFYHIMVIHHTHWDREWWATYQDFRIRLVDLIDDLLNTLDRDASFAGFLLDSQVIVLRDYLEIRPENRGRLVGYIRTGRIQCGPWYILPDEFLVSGEAHIRNLLLARRAARELECPLLSVGYIPDTFGHFAQMPQLLRGFGIDNAFIWRGRGGDSGTIKQEFLWESPDGSQVLTHWFPDGYYQMPFLHFDNPDRPYEDKLGRIFRSIERLGPRATTDVLLMPYGGDHRTIDRDLSRKIKEANAAIGAVGKLHWATPGDYIAAVRAREPALEIVRGELRGFGRENPHVLPGVLSARLYLKRLNFGGQVWLEKYAEPLSALAWVHGGPYDTGLLWRAWEYLIQNHPHDSICGCSIDQVHREMIPRFDQSRQIAIILAEKSAQYLNARIDTSGFSDDDRTLVSHNSLAEERTGWTSVWIERDTIDPVTHRLLDPDGRETAFQTRDVEGMLPTRDRFFYTEVGFVAEGVGGFGYRTYRLTRRDAPRAEKRASFTAIQATAGGKGCNGVTDLAVGAGALENRYLRVDVDGGDGTVTITDKSTGEVYRGLNAFEDGGDAGDTYNYSAPLEDVVLRSTESARAHVSVAEAGHARSTLRIDLDWQLPKEISEDRLSRSAQYIDVRISSSVSLTAHARHLDITTEWYNGIQDHRLRALLPLGADVTESHAEGHFGIERRPVRNSDAGRGWPEQPVTTMPHQGWVSVSNGKRGLTIANRGLPEFEVLADGNGTVALTLLRAVGWLSRDDLLSRMGGAGPEVPVPDAQSLGPNRASYAIIPHAGDWLSSGSYRVAGEYLTPLYGSVGGVHAGTEPPSAALIGLEGEHSLVLSASKRGECTDTLILRFWNAAGSPTAATVRLAREPKDVQLVDLKEEPLENAAVAIADDGSFRLHAGPSRIVTVAVQF